MSRHAHVHVHTDSRARTHTHRSYPVINYARLFQVSILGAGGKGGWGEGAFFIIPLKVSIVSAEGFANFTPACLGIEKEPRHATAGLSPIEDRRATFNYGHQTVCLAAATSLQLRPDRRERPAPEEDAFRGCKLLLCQAGRKRRTGRLTGCVPARRSLRHYLFLFFVASQIDF